MEGETEVLVRHWPLMTSLLCGAFTLGGVYLMHQQNTKSIESLGGKVEKLTEIVTRVDERTKVLSRAEREIAQYR